MTAEALAVAAEGVVVRIAAVGDLPGLVRLMHDHAAYERAAPPGVDLARRLPALLSAPSPRLHALVATSGHWLVGYATASLELSSWRAAEYLHMDCLYVRESARGSGTGAALLEAVRRLAHDLGSTEVQWQTPDWNAGAIRFYDRAGATGEAKRRYTVGALHPSGT